MCRFGQQTVFGQFQANLPRQILRFIIIDYQRIQQSLAPDQRSHTRCFAQFSHLFPEYQSQPVCPVRQLFVPYYLKRRNSHCRSNRISAKSGAMLPGRITSITSLHDNTAETGQAPPDKAFPKIKISG